MIKVLSLYHSWHQGDILTDITNFCKTISYSGSKDQPARKVEGTITYPIFDKNQPRTQIGPSNVIWLLDENGNTFFQGLVLPRQLNSTNQELQFTAYDFMFYLLKSKGSYNFKNITPEDIVSKLCAEVNIKTGSIAATCIPIKRIVPIKSMYDIIMECYTQASKLNLKQYIPIMQADKLNVIEKGQVVADYTINIDENLIDTTYSDTMENMVNRVKIYDDAGNCIGQLDASYGPNFGILQEGYQIEKDKDYKTVAANMFHGIDNTACIECLGNLKCITGYAVKTKIWYVDMLDNKTWYIDNDKHTWDFQNNKYTMQLTLNSSNLMDLKEVSN